MLRHARTEADSPAVSSLFAGRVEYFFSVEVTPKNSAVPRTVEVKAQGSGAGAVATRVHYFAKCRWYTESKRSDHLSKTVWSTDLVGATEADNVIPVQRIAASFLVGRLKSNHTLFQVLVLPNQLCAWDPYDIEDEDLSEPVR